MEYADSGDLQGRMEALRKSKQYMPEEEIWDITIKLLNGLRDLGFRVGPEASPVIAAIFEDRETAIRYWQGLLDQGVLVNLVVPPGSPSTYSLLRASASAAHTEEQIQRILAAYANLKLRDAA